jgi:hypothetical protein
MLPTILVHFTGCIMFSYWQRRVSTTLQKMNAFISCIYSSYKCTSIVTLCGPSESRPPYTRTHELQEALSAANPPFICADPSIRGDGSSMCQAYFS